MQVMHADVIPDDEINLWQAVDFFLGHYRVLLTTGFVGMLLSVGGWSALAAYKAEATLNVKCVSAGCGLDFMTWRNLQKNLPSLAAQVAERTPQENIKKQLMKMSASTWWQKSVTPTYALSKSDTKDLASISKQLQENGSESILNLVVTDVASSKADVEQGLDIAVTFIQRGALFLGLKDLLNRYEANLLNVSSLDASITNAEVELGFMRSRLESLNLLRSRYPGSDSSNSQQALDPKDPNAKYLPLSTQLVATSIDINNAVESLVRMRSGLTQTMVMREFFSRAAPILKSEMDGLLLADRLLEIEEKMRNAIPQNDLPKLQALNSIKSDLLSIRTKFTKGLEANAITAPGRSSPVLPAIGGLVGAGFLALMWLVMRHGWMKYRTAHESN
jgi:hypothetical protein